MLRCLELLELCDVSCIAIPCNTAHCWFDELQSESAVPILHIVDAVHNVLADRNALASPVGLLATTATVCAGVYAKRLAHRDVRCIAPNEREQMRVMKVIRAVKAGAYDGSGEAQLHSVIASLRDRGAGAIILGCTELPLALSANDHGFVDSTAALALECLRQRRKIT